MTDSFSPPGVCQYCGVKVDDLVLDCIGKEFRFARYCCDAPNCIEARKEAQQEDEYYARREKSKGDIPTVLAKTDIKSLPSEKARGLTKWMPRGSLFNGDKSRSKNNLFICGPSRTGKSRVMATIAVNLGVERGWTPKWCDAWALEEAVMSHKSEPLRTLAQHRLLLIDDLGKERMTERMASGIFKLLDLRCSFDLPTIITSNWTPTVLSERFNDTTIADAVKGRLIEFYDRVLLDSKELL